MSAIFAMIVLGQSLKDVPRAVFPVAWEGVHSSSQQREIVVQEFAKESENLGPGRHPAVNRNGTLLAYAIPGDVPTLSVRRLPLGNSPGEVFNTRLSAGEVTHIAWFPRSDRLLVTIKDQDGSVARVYGPDFKPIGLSFDLGKATGNAAISGDERTAIYPSASGWKKFDLNDRTETDFNARSFVSGLSQGTEITSITALPGTENDWIFAAKKDDWQAVFLIRSGASSAVRLSPVGSTAYDPKPTQDPRFITFRGKLEEGDREAIFAIRVDGRAVSQISEIEFAR